MNITVHQHQPQTAIHRLRLIASFTLLGAVVAGSFEVFPMAATVASVIDLQAIGAVLGGLAGTISQIIRH